MNTVMMILGIAMVVLTLFIAKRAGELAGWFALALMLTVVTATAVTNHAKETTWRGLTVSPENRCSSYIRKDYPYPQSVEREIVYSLGAIYGPYTNTCFASTYETDIEHIIALSEAHDSGLCSADPLTRARFATDLRNLTLASPKVNRLQKINKDAAEWLPTRNRCWFANRVVEVRRAYNLTIDKREAHALEQILTHCKSTAMEPITCK